MARALLDQSERLLGRQFHSFFSFSQPGKMPTPLQCEAELCTTLADRRGDFVNADARAGAEIQTRAVDYTGGAAARLTLIVFLPRCSPPSVTGTPYLVALRNQPCLFGCFVRFKVFHEWESRS